MSALPLLLIEDNEELREEMSAYFRRRGKTVIPCATLSDARSVLNGCSGTGQPDAVICDANLPDGSGIDFCVEAGSRLPGCRWILISGAHEHDRLEEALSIGAHFTVVDKPVSLRQLSQLLVAQGSGG